MVLVDGTDLFVDEIGLIASPRILGTGAAADGDRVHVTGLYVTARVTNRGRERWASRGEVSFMLRAGRDGDAPASARRATEGVSTVPSSSGSSSILERAVMAPFGPFTALTSISGSLAPGESRVIRTLVGNRNEQSRLIFQRDKYYTVTSTLRATGDADASNNRSQRAGRFDANRTGLLISWEPITIGGAGAVRVSAPPR